jgi:hypothetical protein
MAFDRRVAERTLDYINEHRDHTVKWPGFILLDGKHYYPNSLVWRVRNGLFTRTSGDLLGTAALAHFDVYCEVAADYPRKICAERVRFQLAEILFDAPKPVHNILDSRWRWPDEYKDDSQYWEWEDYPEDSTEVVVAVLKRTLREGSMEFMWERDMIQHEKVKDLGWGDQEG